MAELDMSLFERDMLLDHPEMDDTHREFVQLFERIARARGEAFADLFEDLLDHTREHFRQEEALMHASRFPALGEHQGDHLRVLGDMNRFAQRVRQGSSLMARAWVRDQLPDWFNVHLRNMDSALAAHLKMAAQKSA